MSDKGASSIPRFCADHNISKSFYYTLPMDLRPKVMRVGNRVLISDEAAAEWRRRMEVDANEAA